MFRQCGDTMDMDDMHISSTTDPSSKRAANRRVLRAAHTIGATLSLTREELYSDSDSDV